jgi:hypothetical protein
VKSFGANIVCDVCQAQPHPDPGSGFRETFDLVKIDGAWRCELHRPAKIKRASRVTVVTPADAVDQFEQVLAAQSAHLEEAVADGGREDIRDALKEHNDEIERALGELKEAIAAQRPPPVEKAVKYARPRPINARERNQDGQGDLIADPTEEGGS